MARSTQEFHLIVEEPRGVEGGVLDLTVAGVCRLFAASAEPARLADQPEGGLVELEPVELAHSQSRLMALALTEEPIIVNGHRAPRVALLQEKDSAQVGAALFHVAVFHRPQVGPPGPEQVGRECVLCRLPMAAESQCIACGCGAVLHCETGGPEALECARLVRNCPACGRSVTLTEGFLWRPEVGNE